MPEQQRPRDRFRFGIGEWYGYLLHRLDVDELKLYADIQKMAKSDRPLQPCPFQGVACTKAGGICSVRLYVEHRDTKEVEPSLGDAGRLRIVCPYRFRENGLIYRWVSETILGSDDPLIINEVGFLAGITTDDSNEGSADVGRIDQVLLVSDSKPLDWCALEIQAVYFSGARMGGDFEAIKAHTAAGADLPFPAGNRHPDYRSSGPKRLMPQLQIKVPTLRRWGRKMAVVVDRDFFIALAPMVNVQDVSNCDIVWFVVDLCEEDGQKRAHLMPGETHLTTLEHAVEGLTAGIPVSKEEFERRILEKYRNQRTRSERSLRTATETD